MPETEPLEWGWDAGSDVWWELPGGSPWSGIHEGARGSGALLPAGCPPYPVLLATHIVFLKHISDPHCPSAPRNSQVFAGSSVSSFSLPLGPPISLAASPAISYFIASPHILLLVPLPSPQKILPCTSLPRRSQGIIGCSGTFAETWLFDE